MYPGFEEGSMGIFEFAGFGIDPPENGMTSEYADGGHYAGGRNMPDEEIMEIIRRELQKAIAM